MATAELMTVNTHPTIKVSKLEKNVHDTHIAMQG
jgi:hypothetical protein